MYLKLTSLAMVVTGWVLGSFFLGCSSVELTKVPKKPLPAHPPQLSELALELPPEGGPRRPVDPMAMATLSGPGPEITIVESDQPVLRTTAEQDPAVKNQLGDRFAFIHTEEVPADRCLVTVQAGDPATTPRATERVSTSDASAHRLTYYSYTHNVAVHVCLRDHQVASVQKDPREGYQPEEGEEEIPAAIELAKSDPRLSSDVQNLHGHAILTSPEEYRYFWVNDEAGFGNRVFWVTFSEMPESLALYFARVDLTSQTVLDAGKEAGPQ
ncbi:MAG: hypothetical protein KC592_08295 [Nitrospira sp.]|nr:hypothetical protein [Nitrospira sp.]HBP88254.1 hypothetical protein [Nitrospiraceae bacterium]HNP28799.1 hypothetical protein [Nitrospirales bacterium]